MEHLQRKKANNSEIELLDTEEATNKKTRKKIVS